MSTSMSSFGYQSVGYPTARQTVPLSSVLRRPVATRLRMTRRGRAVLLTLVTTPLVTAALALSLNGGGATATGSAVPLKTVTVSSGESLWQISVKVAPNSDPRDVIADIMSLNNLSSADVQPGQQLEIPAQYER